MTYGSGGPAAPAYGKLFPDSVPASAVSTPGVFVFDKNFQNPRTFSATLGYERQIGSEMGASISYTHARTDHLTRFFNANDTLFGVANLGPWGTGTKALGTLTVVTGVSSRAFCTNGPISVTCSSWSSWRVVPGWPLALLKLVRSSRCR